jgi:hypothetical protein
MLPKYNPKLKSSEEVPFDKLIEDPSSSDDCHYYFRASLSGLVLSLIDKVPSEVAVITFRKIVAMSEWNSSRTKEATAALSIDWTQIDNHCPNASFPVALFPSKERSSDEVGSDSSEVDRAFLSAGVVLAPTHKSNITVSCFKFFVF